MAKLRSSDPPVPAFGTCCHDLLEQFGESALVAAKSGFPDLDKDAVGLKSLVLRERAKYGPAEPLNFVAYSGGLTVAFNAALFLQSMGIAIDNVVSVGGATLRGKPGNVATWTAIWGGLDVIQGITTLPDKLVTLPFATHEDYFNSTYLRRPVRIIVSSGVQ